MIVALLMVIILILLLGATAVKTVIARMALVALAGFFAIVLLVPRQDDPTPPEEPLFVQYPVPTTLDELRAKTGSAWDYRMKPADYPDTFAKLGEAAFNRANDLSRWAAAVAAESADCDRAGSSDVSDISTRSRLRFFVDCDNGVRIWVNEGDAEDARARWTKRFPA